MFEWHATYRPDEPRMSRWRWWAVFIFLPPIALLIVWRDKKFLKQMALVIFYISTILLPVHPYIYLINIEFLRGIPNVEVPLTSVMLSMAGMTFGILVAVYAQRAIIKTEERIRKARTRGDSSDEGS